MLSILYCTFINLLYSFVGWKRKQASRGSALNLERTVQLPFLSLEGEEGSEGVTGGKSLAKHNPCKGHEPAHWNKAPNRVFYKGFVVLTTCGTFLKCGQAKGSDGECRMLGVHTVCLVLLINYAVQVAPKETNMCLRQAKSSILNRNVIGKMCRFCFLSD